MLLRNINPQGTVDVPALRKTLTPGEVFEVDDDLGNTLLQQGDNYQQVTTEDEE